MNIKTEIFLFLSALDPAKPWFDHHPSQKISKEDAELVDVMHTNSGAHILQVTTLDSLINVPPGITVPPGLFFKINKHTPLI